jgi:hypothetical protein
MSVVAPLTLRKAQALNPLRSGSLAAMGLLEQKVGLCLESAFDFLRQGRSKEDPRAELMEVGAVCTDIVLLIEQGLKELTSGH